MVIAASASGLSRPFTLVVMGLLLVLFACLSINGVGVYHFSADEMMHLDIARGRTLGEVLGFSIFEPHPPLGHLLRHYWIVISEDAAFVRTQSLLFGIATVLVFYRIGDMLGGRLAGFCVAAFAAFCPPVILQSYLVRNYGFFAFFVSLSFYYYLRWQETRGNDRLLPFALAGALACLTHLSGVFALATLGGYEVLRTRFASDRLRALIPWILVNAAIGMMMLIVWYILLPKGIEPFQHYARRFNEVRWSYGLYYIPQTFDFLLSYPHGANMFYMLPGGLAVLAFAGWRVPSIRMPLGLMVLGVLLGAFLRGTNFYPFIDSRHVLWLMPFVATSCGLALAAGCRWLRRTSGVPLPALMLLILLAGWGLYAPEKRFHQIFEYQITEPQWQELVDYLSGLDARHLIVSRRADTVLIDPPGQNPYLYMGNDPLTVTVPYYHTRILFDPTRAHTHHYLDDLPLRMIQEAQARGELDGVDTLVFVNSSWTSRISQRMVELMLCPSFTKTIRQFPADAAARPLHPGIIYRTPATLMIVPKQQFLDEVVAEGGSARACFK